MSQITLANARAGDQCIVLEIAPDRVELKSRLYALGIIPGSLLEILRFAPLGDPMQVKVGSSFVSIRKLEANAIIVDTQ